MPKGVLWRHEDILLVTFTPNTLLQLRSGWNGPLGVRRDSTLSMGISQCLLTRHPLR
jgi:hypothetical protein